MACSSLLLTPTCRMQLPFSPPPVQSIARQLLPRSCVFTCQMQFFSPPPPVFSHVKCSFFSPPAVQSIARQLLPRSSVFTRQMQFFSPPPVQSIARQLLPHSSCVLFATAHWFGFGFPARIVIRCQASISTASVSTAPDLPTVTPRCAPISKPHVKRSFLFLLRLLNSTPASVSLLCFVCHRPLVRVWVPSWNRDAMSAKSPQLQICLP
jgi:hypothetical protein